MKNARSSRKNSENTRTSENVSLTFLKKLEFFNQETLQNSQIQEIKSGVSVQIGVSK